MLRHGKWMYDETIGGMKHYCCSNCKKITPGNECFADENQILWFKFCPKCGAEMNGDYDRCYGYVIKSNTMLYYCGDTRSFSSAITDARVYVNEKIATVAINELRDTAFSDRYTLELALVEIHEVDTESEEVDTESTNKVVNGKYNKFVESSRVKCLDYNFDLCDDCEMRTDSLCYRGE